MTTFQHALRGPARSPARAFQSLALAAIAMIWVWAGISTWNDLIGKPRDAPFLWIPGHMRSIWFWWVPALNALWQARSGKHVPIAFAALAIGPGIRFGSYMVSWMASWRWVDPFIPDDDMKGDPNAYGSAWIYLFALVALMLVAYASRRMVEQEAQMLTLIAARVVARD